MSGPESDDGTGQDKGRVMDGALVGDGGAALAFTGLSRRDQVSALDERLDRGVHGLCFSAYQEGQSPERKSRIDPAQTRARLELLAGRTRWVRTFSCSDGNDAAPAIAHELGMKTLVGAWLGEDRAENERELAAVAELARAGHADIVAVGNEVLYREELSEDELVAYLHRARELLPAGTPIGYVDAYYLIAQHPRIVAASDVLLINCYPFWERCSLERSLGYVQEMVARVARVAGGKRIVISETGWPSAGAPLGDAIPSMEGALLYALNLMDWCERQGIDLFYFAAFDEDWKAGPEGGCGPHWGLWDKHGARKHVL